jgi:hypothetical protein
MLGLFGSNVQLWVNKKSYPKSINVRCISNYISKSTSFVIVQQFFRHLKIYYNAKQVEIIVDDRNILGWSIVLYMFYKEQ